MDRRLESLFPDVIRRKFVRKLTLAFLVVIVLVGAVRFTW